MLKALFQLYLTFAFLLSLSQMQAADRVSSSGIQVFCDKEPVVFDDPETPVPHEWHWKAEFTPENREKIESWIRELSLGAQITLGIYPFTMHIHIYDREDSDEPVPWAHTWRYPEQSLHFYVDADFSLKDFLADWTAPHEISHLSIPYLGESNSWFAEGYASFMQYQVMKTMGILSEEEIQGKYQQKINMVKPYYLSSEDLENRARQLGKNKQFPAMYWGSSAYFLILDRILKESYNTDLCGIVRKYQDSGRLKDGSLKAVLHSWDALIGEPVCQLLLDRVKKDPAIEIIEEASYLIAK